MTLCEKIRLVDDMIRENSEVTIKDYVELEKEISGIEGRSEQVFLLKKVNQEARIISRSMNRIFAERYNEIRL